MADDLKTRIEKVEKNLKNWEGKNLNTLINSINTALGKIDERLKKIEKKVGIKDE